MKRGALGLLALIALAIGWLAWSSRVAEEPPVADRPLEATTDAPKPDGLSVATASEGTRAPLNSNAAAEPATSDPLPADGAPSAILLRGTVRDEQGNPLNSAGLSCTDDQGFVTRAGITDGSFSVPGLHPGHFILDLSGWGLRTEQFDIELPPQPDVQQRDLISHACPQVAIKLVHEDGTLAFGEGDHVQPGNMVRVIASKRRLSALDPALRDSIVHQADCGRFVNRWELKYHRTDFAADLFGVLELREDPPISVSLMLGGAVLQERELNELPTELVFQLREQELESALCGLRVRIVGADGKTPVANGHAMLHGESVRDAKADADGRVEFRDLRASSFTLRLSGGGGSAVSRSIELGPGRVLDLGDVALRPAPKLRLHFEFPGEEMQVLFVMKPERPDDPLATLGALDNSQFGNGGKNPYEISAFGPGSYELRVTGFGDPRDRESNHLGARPLHIVLSDGDVGEYTVKIEATTEICLRPPGKAADISRWLVSTAGGLPCKRVRVEGRAPTRIELVPGEYTIARIDSETQRLGTPQSFTVGASFFTLDLAP